MSNIKLQCDDCDKIITVDESKWSGEETHENCGGEFTELDNEEESSRDIEICIRCKRKVDTNKEDMLCCGECDDEICNRCGVEFEGLGYELCKKCIDKVYPRKTEVTEKIIYQDKFVYLDKPKESKHKVSLIERSKQKSRFEL